MAVVSIQQALQFVADHPEPDTDVVVDQPVHELVARALYRIANSPDARQRGSMARATRAMKLITNRLTGTRRPGTHPVARKSGGIEFHDLTAGALR